MSCLSDILSKYAKMALMGAKSKFFGALEACAFGTQCYQKTVTISPGSAPRILGQYTLLSYFSVPLSAHVQKWVPVRS